MAELFVSEKSLLGTEPSPFGSYGHRHASRTAHDASSTKTETQSKQEVTSIVRSIVDKQGQDATSDDNGQNHKPWFREIGATSTGVVIGKRVWSPDFEDFTQNKRWGESYMGRTWLRFWGRFVIGTAFYSVAQLYANRALANYTGENPQNPLQWVAYAIDKTAGAGIKKVFGEKAVTFHETRDYGYKTAAGGVKMGRSLGHEAVGVTFDFAAMSTGDYMTRYFVGLMGPNAKTKWVKNGRINLFGGLQELGTQIFKSITYASGEDMFVGIPYVYFMKLSRHVINKFSPGFKYDSDYSLFGGSFKVNDKKQVIGDYNMEGIVDITARFSAYNIGTKMFRDLYASVQDKITHFTSGRVEPSRERKKESQSLVRRFIQNPIRYTLVTSTKMLFVMLPSAFLFAVLRTPQYKKNTGLMVDPNKGPVGRLMEEGLVSTPRDHFSNKMYRDGNTPPWYSSITNPLGRASYDLARTYEKGFNKVNLGGILSETPLPKALGQADGKSLVPDFTNRYVDAATSYFPYFVVKSDWLTAFYDTNRTDFVLGGFYSSLWNMTKSLISLDGNKIGKAGGDVKSWWNEVLLATLKQPSPNYEVQIQQVMNDQGYKSSNEAFDIYQGQKNYTRHDEGRDRKLGGDELLKEVESIEAYREAMRKQGKENTGVEGVIQKDVVQKDEGITDSGSKKEDDNGKDNEPVKFADRIQPRQSPAPLGHKEEGWAASVQKKEPVSSKSLLDRVTSSEHLMPPGSNAIN